MMKRRPALTKQAREVGKAKDQKEAQNTAPKKTMLRQAPQHKSHSPHLGRDGVSECLQ